MDFRFESKVKSRVQDPTGLIHSEKSLFTKDINVVGQPFGGDGRDPAIGVGAPRRPAHNRLDCRIMVDTESQVSELAGELQRVLSKVLSVLRHTGRTSTSGDLTLAQLSILLTLLDQGPIRMTDLATHERVRTPTTTVAIRRLEKLGLVKRSRDPSDLRAVLVDITPEGRAQHRESLASRQAHLAALLSKLSEDELDALAKGLAPLERIAD